MPEFDRTAVILAELASLDDVATAQIAEITFVTQEDHGVLRTLRESLAEEYTSDNVDTDDRERTARVVGEDVAGRGDRMVRFASLHDIGSLRVTPAYDHEGVPVAYGDDLDTVVLAALTTRFTHAAYTLITYLEDDADTKESDHDDTGE